MPKLSTENTHLIPHPIKLQQICKSIAALEAIICPEWEYRYYSYQKEWSAEEEFCGMRDGQGDQMLILFSPKGAVINGFAHESKMSGWRKVPVNEKKSFFDKLFSSQKKSKTELIQVIAKGVIDELPGVFNEFILGEPVKSIGTTFCIWHTKSDEGWKAGRVDLPKDEYKDGSSDLLQLLDGNPSSYKEWAEDYYEENFEDRKLDLGDVKKVYNGMSITKELVDAINPTLEDFDQLKTDLDEIGYDHTL